LVVLLALLPIETVQEFGEVLTEWHIVYVLEFIAFSVHAVIVYFHEIVDEPHLANDALPDWFQNPKIVDVHFRSFCYFLFIGAVFCI
jgi:hypothetical protein